MGGFSIWHWIVVLLIVLLIFGTRKLKDLGKDLGESVRNFKNAINEDKKDNNVDSVNTYKNDKIN